MPAARKTTPRPNPPRQQRRRAPATPARGSSPITPPGGSAPRPSRSRAAPRPLPRPPSPMARALMRRQQLNQPPPAMQGDGRPRQPYEPNVAARGGGPLAAPAPAAVPPQMQTRPGPAPIQRPAGVPVPPTVFEGGRPEGLDALQAAATAPRQLPGQDALRREVAYPLAKRFNEAYQAVTAPVYEETPPPTTSGIDPKAVIGSGLFNGARSPSVVGTVKNADGTTDWLVRGADGRVTNAPRTRQKPPNLLTQLGRALGQGAAMGLEVWGLSAKGTERGLGGGMQERLPIKAPVILPGGKTFTPTQIPAWVPASAADMGLSPSATTLVQAARQLYGATPEVDTALRDVTRIAYSSPEAQLRAVARIVEFGQLPDLALYGDGNYVTETLVPLGYLDDPWKAIQADPLAKYVAETLAAEGRTQAEIIDTFNTAGLVGEEELGRELLGQIVLDPLNLIGSPAGKWIQAQRAAGALKWFGPSTRALPEILNELGRLARPTGKPILDALNPLAHTPTAVRDKVVNLAGDALSFGLTAATQNAGKVDEVTGKARPALATVLRALVDTAEEAPLRADFADDAAYELARRGWQATQDNARAMLSHYPVLLSDAGKLAGAVTRQMLLDDTGKVTGKAILDLVQSGKSAHEVVADIMGRMEQAAVDLLTPARQGARTATEFAEFTGRAAQEFPIFERGLAGASERVALSKADAAYKVSPIHRALAGFSSVRNTINSGLWHLFASANPAYAFRNAANNLVTALADGNMAFASGEAIGKFNREILGAPLAAYKGIGGSASAQILGGKGKALGFAGLSQRIEEKFSQRIVYAAAKRYLDRVFEIGKAIPDLPPSVMAAIGDETALGLTRQLAATYGDVDAALAWLRRQGGQVEIARILDSTHAKALTEFDPEFQRKVVELLDGAKTLDELRAGLAALRREAAQKLRVAEEAVPPVAAMNDTRAAAYAEDMRAAEDAGVRVEGTRPQDFEARLKADRQMTDTARGVAAHALQNAPTDDAARAGIAQFIETDTAVSKLSAEARQAHDALRQATRNREVAIRSMKIKPAAKGAMLDDLWRKYFADRDAIWTRFREQAVARWNEFSRGLGVDVDELSIEEQIRLFEKSFTDEAAEYAGGVGLANEMTADIERSIFAKTSTPAQPNAKMLWTRIDPQTGRSVWQEGVKPKGAPFKWDGDTKKWHRVAASEIDDWVEQQYTKLGGDISAGKTATEMWDEIVEAYRAAKRARGAAKKGAAPKVGARAPALGQRVGVGPTALPEPGGPPMGLRMPGGTGPGPRALPVGGGGEPLSLALTAPIPRKWTPADPRSILSVLNDIERAAIEKWGQARPVNLDDEAWKLLGAWAEGARRQAQEARAIAAQVGSEARNFALLNYGDRRNIDMWLGVVMPYQYWYGRTYKNWMQRAVTNPVVLANYGRYRTALEKMHAGLPEYWRQQLSTDDLGIDMDTPLMFNLEQTLSPLYGILGSDFKDENRRRAQLFGMEGFGAYAEDAGALGPTLWAPIIWTLAAANMRRDPEAAMAWVNTYLGSGARALRAASALANETAAGQGLGIPQGGINLDPQMFFANMAAGGGMSGTTTTQWERQRIAGILTSYLENPPPDVDPATWQAQLMDAAYTQSGELWEKATQEMFAGTAPAVLVSYGLGLGFKGRAEYEAEFSQIWSEVSKIRSLAATLTPEEMQQQYLNLERRHPMYDLLMLSRANGPERNDAWVWEAMSRVGIGDREAWEAAGVSEAALDAFFAAKTTQGMDPVLLGELLDAASLINARNRPRSLEESQRQLDAQIAYNQIKADLEKQVGPEAFELEQEYFAVRDAQGPDAASAWLDNLETAEQGLIYGLWDARAEAQMAAGEDVQAYYVDPERYEQLLVGRFYDEQEALAPGIRDLNNTYKELRRTGDYDAAALLKEEHPELQAYWDAQSKFYDGLQGEVSQWLKGLPETTQGAARSDFDPYGMAADKLTGYYSGKDAERQGGYKSQYADDEGGAPADAATVSAADQYRQRAEEARQAKLDDQGYLNSENRLAYGDAMLEPWIAEYGPDGAAAFLEQPIAQEWPVTAAGVQGLLSIMGEAESVREGLMLYAAQSKNANWTRYVGWLRSLPEEELDALARRYPQLADARIVADQARAYEYPTYSALHDILGFTVSFREDGTYGITRQTVKKDKKTGAYGFDVDAGSLGPARAGGGYSAGAGTPASVYERLSTRRSSRRGGGGGGGGRGGGGGWEDDGPDPTAEAIAGWIAFSSKLKLEQPDILVQLVEFFETADPYARQALLQRYPALLAYLQSLGGKKLLELEQQFGLWRNERDAAQAQLHQRQVRRPTGQTPRITRYYSQRPTTSGL